MVASAGRKGEVSLLEYTGRQTDTQANANSHVDRRTDRKEGCEGKLAHLSALAPAGPKGGVGGLLLSGRRELSV